MTIKKADSLSYDWLGQNNRPIKGKDNFGLIGILNITPDSFYDGGKYNSLASSMRQAKKLCDEGADVLDIGAESTRPGALPLDPKAEIARLEPILENLAAQFDRAIISIDTRNARTASYALEMGASIINDVSACEHDPHMIDVVAQFRPAYILMHAQGDPLTMQLEPTYKDVVHEIMRFFEQKMTMLVRHGLPENKIALDPGIGFGKNLHHNLEILRNMRRFLEFGRPVIAAFSMKSLFGALLGHNTEKRLADTVLASVLLWQQGIYWHRVHHVQQIADAFKLANAMGAHEKKVFRYPEKDSCLKQCE